MTEPIAEAAQYYAAGDLTRAAQACNELIRCDPAHFDALHLLGVICARQTLGADAAAWLLRAEAVRSEDAQLQANLGNAYGLVQRFDRAEAHYRKAWALNAGNPGIANNLGLTLRGLGRHDEAAEFFRAALITDPWHAAARFNLAGALTAADNLEDAELHYRRVLAVLPQDAPEQQISGATNDLAQVILQQGRAEEALATLRDAAAKRAGGSVFPWNESLILLTLGRFPEGWPAYEARWEAPNHEPRPRDHRVLDLDQIAGRRVLVMHEQGRGDIIQFLRYMRPLAARGARIRITVYDDLVPLARELPDVEQTAGPEDVVDYDLLTSVMSLPLAFRTDLATIPAEVPYLRTPAGRVAGMRHHLGSARAPRIGVAWSGSPASYARSAMPVSALEPLLRRPNVEFHCLQKEVRAEDRAWLDQTGLVTTHEPMLRDFADTAALIDAMDLVISVDTAVAHLAGALAKPVWIMLPFCPDWRWMLHREDSPWYPTARLFRQTKRGNWTGVAEAVARACPF